MENQLEAQDHAPKCVESSGRSRGVSDRMSFLRTSTHSEGGEAPHKEQVDASHIHLPDSLATPRLTHWVRGTSSSLRVLVDERIAPRQFTESTRPSRLVILLAQWWRPEPFLQDFDPAGG